jgi:Fe-S-cluster containining protein
VTPHFNSFLAGATYELQAANSLPAFKRVVRVAHEKVDTMIGALLTRIDRKVACCAGCFYCCHGKVDVQPGDAFVIADFIKQNFLPQDREAVLAKAKSNWEKIAPLTASEHFHTQLPCPLLVDRKCSVYNVRPTLCRSYHSVSAEACRRKFEQPQNDGFANEPIQELAVAAAGATMGITSAFSAKGLDSLPYDLNGALVEALSNPSSERRWRDGKPAFPKNMIAKDFAAPFGSADSLPQPAD